MRLWKHAYSVNPLWITFFAPVESLPPSFVREMLQGVA